MNSRIIRYCAISFIALLLNSSSCQLDPEALVIIETKDVTEITYNSCVTNGSVRDIGNGITQHGFCWATTQNPTVDSPGNNKLGLKGAPGEFSSTITGLDPETTYYVRAYGTDGSGIVYGSNVSFATPSQFTLPVVSTSSVSGTTETSAQGGGNVTDDGRATVTAKGVCWSTSSNPTVSDSHTTDGTGTGSFSSSLEVLNAYTTYYVRAYATNTAGTSYGNELSFKTLWDNSKMTDREGNEYSTVQIGDQIWMAENLRATKYPSGVSIPLVEDVTEWNNLGTTERGYCWYNNNTSTGNTYGALYTWATATGGSNSSDNPSGIQGVCPNGWHMPSDDEWKELEISLGMSQIQADGIDFRGTDEGGKLKVAGTTYWADPNTGATNSSGMSILPAGGRYGDMFSDLGATGYYWTCTSFDGTRAYYRGFGYNSAQVHRFYYKKNNGFSVRCVKD